MFQEVFETGNSMNNFVNVRLKVNQLTMFVLYESYNSLIFSFPMSLRLRLMH